MPSHKVIRGPVRTVVPAAAPAHRGPRPHAAYAVRFVLAATTACVGAGVAAARSVPERTTTPVVDASALQVGAWVLKEPVVYRASDRVPVPEENQQGSFTISPTGASSTFSWSNSSTGRSGSMSTSHAWTPPPAVLSPGQTIEVSVSSTLAISGSGDG